MSIKRNDSFLGLRKQAEKMLKGRRVEEADQDFEELIQELEVHHVELDLQNEELRRTQKELEASRNEYFSLYNSAPSGFVTVGAKGLITRTNRTAEEMLVAQSGGLIGRPFSSLICPEDIHKYSSLLISLGWHHKGDAELRMIGSHGLIHVRIEAVAYLDETGGFSSWHFSISDITKRKEAEAELRKAHDQLESRVRERTAQLEKEIEKRVKFEEALKASAEKLASLYLQRKHLSQKLVELVEKDRREIAMTLHDEVGSILTGAKLEIEVMESELAESPALDRIIKVKETVTEAMEIVRNISHHLRPSALDRFGLVPAIMSLAEEVAKRSGIKIKVYGPEEGMPDGVSPEKQLALYRIVQESLTNALKHAEAKEVFITLSCRNGTIYLSVEDDGKGFNYDSRDENGVRQGHLGISIMKERASEFDGEFRLEASPGKGTQTMVEVPVQEPA